MLLHEGVTLFPLEPNREAMTKELQPVAIWTPVTVASSK
jgi:hypothetical protein